MIAQGAGVRVVGQGVEAHAGVPQAQVDAVRAERLERGDVGLPASHRIDAAAQQRGHVGADRHDIDLVLGNPVPDHQGLEQHQASGLDADAFSDHVLRRTDRRLLEREKGIGVLLQANREALDRQPFRHGQHDRWARRDLADLTAPGGNDRHAIDIRAAGLDPEIDAFLLVVAEPPGDNLAHLVAAGHPAQLHIDRGPVGREAAHRQQRARGGQSARHDRGLQQLSAPRIFQS
ncbi:hypothetical protein D9M70_357580 [compost metagenome]